MSGTGNQKMAGEHQEYYPPPPPGPPPNPLGSNPHNAPQQHAQQQQYGRQQQSVPQHSDETPIQDYHNPAHPPQQQYHEPAPSELYGNDDPPAHHNVGGTAAAASATKPSWSQRFAGIGAKAAAPLNALANKVGGEGFLPMSMDKESEKAARILRSFCKDGIYSDWAPQGPNSQPAAPPATTAGSAVDAAGKPTDASKPKKPRVLLTIPSKVIARAQGLAIFTTVRAGFHLSGASGSGILIARLPDGSWSPPSGIQVHSVGAGFVIGLDIYDCVVVINTREALEAFTRTRMSLGSDLAVAAGPWGAGGQIDFGMPQSEKGRAKSRDGRIGDEKPLASDHVYPTGPAVTTGTGTAPTATLSTPATGSKDRKPSPLRDAISKPVYSYVKSRGFYAGVQIDGTVITERKDANAAFYGDKSITVDRILRGDVRAQTGEHTWPAAARGLVEVLAGAEGWRGQHGQTAGGPSHAVGHEKDHASSQPTSHGAGYGTGVAGVTEGVRGLDVNAGPSAQPAAGQPYDRSSKAAEAAAEARANEPLPAGPPSYYQPETHHGEESPPAYVDDSIPRPGVGDTKGH